MTTIPANGNWEVTLPSGGRISEALVSSLLPPDVGWRVVGGEVPATASPSGSVSSNGAAPALSVSALLSEGRHECRVVLSQAAGESGSARIDADCTYSGTPLARAATVAAGACSLAVGLVAAVFAGFWLAQFVGSTDGGGKAIIGSGAVVMGVVAFIVAGLFCILLGTLAEFFLLRGSRRILFHGVKGVLEKTDALRWTPPTASR